MTSHQIQLLFADLALILFLGRALGSIGARFGQPPVVGEILAGVALGPTLFHGTIAARLFPTDIRPLLTGMADVGVALFMFCVGLELEFDGLRGRGPNLVRAAVGSTLIPFGLGVAAAPLILRGHVTHNVAAATVFVGLSVSVTAFPVLARILSDRGLTTTTIGGIALSTAAVVDVIAWVGLALVQAVVAGSGGTWRVALMVPFVAAMPLLVRPALRRILGALLRDRPENASKAQLAFLLVVVGALMAGAATEAMGMHFIFGAFLFGAAVPRTLGREVLNNLRERTAQVTSVLLPVFFVVAGFSVDLSKLSAADLLRLGLIMAIAVGGKIGGTYAGARYRGLPSRPASALAVLMNTRGLTELIVLGVGLQLGLLDRRLYSLMVAMAVATTVMTGPLLSRLFRRPVVAPEPVSRRKRTDELRPVGARANS